MDGQITSSVVKFLMTLLVLLANQSFHRKCYATETNSNSLLTETGGLKSQAPYELPQTSYGFITSYKSQPAASALNPNLIKHNYIRLVSNRIGNDYSSDLYKRSQITSLARTAQTPPLSEDLNRPGGPVGAELAKLLNLKQGYYSDLYDEITKPTHATGHMTTKAPVLAFEEAVESAVVSALRGTRNK